MPTFLRRYLPVLVLCLIVPAHGLFANDAWLKVESENFEVLGNASESEIRSVGLKLEGFRASIQDILGRTGPKESARIRVFVFRDRAGISGFLPKLADGTRDELAGGYFLGGEGVNYIVVSAGKDEPSDYPVVFHEYSHYLLKRHFGSREIPAWLNEGLAEYLQTYTFFEDGHAQLGSPQPGHLDRLRREPLMPWDQFFKIDSLTLQQSGKHSRTIFYAQAWAAVHALVHTGGKSMQSAVRELLEPGYRPDVAAISLSVNALIGKKPGEVAPVRFPASLPRAFVKVTAIGDGLSNAHLGDLLYHLRDDSSQIYLAKALAADPELGLANATLGLWRLRQQNFAEARRLLQKAAARGSENHLVHYYNAFLISRDHMDDLGAVRALPAPAAKEMRERLKRAIQLNPLFAESYRLLALVELITGGDLDDALAGIERARSLHPDNAEYGVLAARILLQLGRIDDARATAERILRGPSVRERQAAREIVDLADEYLKSRGQLKLAPARENILILDRRSLTDAEVAKIEEERQINNLNVLIDRPRAGERLAVGFIERADCVNGRIVYRMQTPDTHISLTGRDFSQLRVNVLLTGTHAITLRCDARFTRELVVARYRPAAGSDGELISVSIVPGNFRLKTLEQMAREPFVIIQGGPSSNLEENAKTAAAERAEMERVSRAAELAEIANRLRQPGPGEERRIAVPEKIECDVGKLTLTARAEGQTLSFQAPFARKIEARSYSPYTGLFEIACRAQPPRVPAVLTYRAAEKAGGVPELIAVEFVPAAFTLPSPAK